MFLKDLRRVLTEKLQKEIEISVLLKNTLVVYEN